MRGWLEIPLLIFFIAFVAILAYAMIKLGSHPPAHPYFNLPTPSITGGK